MLRVLRRLFTPKYKNINKFDYSPEGFQKAKRWAKVQPHPFLINLTLWDYVDTGWIDSEHKLHEINKIKEEV
jgi:hypothetical protein